MFAESFLETQTKIREVVDEAKHENANELSVSSRVKGGESIFLKRVEERNDQDARNKSDQDNPEPDTE